MPDRPPIPEPPHRGGCLCGAVRYSYDAAPLATVACHCRDCQKLTGATNLLTIYADRSHFRHEKGEVSRYRKRADSGREAICAAGHQLAACCSTCDRFVGARPRAPDGQSARRLLVGLAV